MKTIIRGGDVVGFDGTRHTLIRNGIVVMDGRVIVHVGESYAGRADVEIDAAGMLVAPGLINLHTHTILQVGEIAMLDGGDRPLYGSVYLACQPRRVSGHLLQVPFEDHVRAHRYSLATLLRGGCTTVLEMGATSGQPDSVPEAARGLGVRLYAAAGFRSAHYYYDGQDALKYDWDEQRGEAGLDSAVAFIRKWNGAENGRIHAFMNPRNADTCTPQLLRRAYAAAQDLDVPMQVHTAQHLLEFHEILRRTNLTPVQYLASLGVLGPRTTLGHCVYVTGHSKTGLPGNLDLRVIAESGASVAHCPLEFVRDGHVMESFHRYRTAGINVALGTDTCPRDLLQEMRLALHASRLIEGTFREPTSRDLLEAATLAGARALNRPDLGRLAPGAAADVILVRVNSFLLGPFNDPVKALVHGASAGDVHTVIVDGEVVVRNGGLMHDSEDDLLRDAQRVAQRLLEHMDWPDKASVIAEGGVGTT